VIELLLQTGMRLSDVSRLKVTDASLPTRIAKEPGSAGAAHILGKGPLHRVLVAKYLAAAGIHGASVHTLRHPFGTHPVKPLHQAARRPGGPWAQ
jgi:site-specific recombinase XerD